MAGSSQLFELIKSLSPTEKRYFKLYSNLQSGEKSYYILFDYLDQVISYDEKELKKDLKGESFTKNLHVTKAYLTNLILKSLRSYYSNKSADLNLYNLLSDFTILEKRGLYRHAGECIQKIKKIAYDLEDFTLLWWAISKEMSLLLSQDERLSQENMRLLTQELLQINQYIQHSTQALVINKKAMVSARLGYLDFHWNENESLFIEELDSDKNLPLLIRTNFYQVKSMEAFQNKDWKTHHYFYKEIVDQWRQNKTLINYYPHLFKINLANYLNSCFRIQSFDEFPAILKEFDALPKGNFNEEAETFQNKAFYELLYLMNTGSKVDYKTEIKEIEKGILTYKNKIHKGRELAFYYNLSLFFFMKKDFNKALDWLNRILNHPKTDQRKDIQRNAHFLQLMYHFDQNHFEFLDSLTSSVERKLKRWDELCPIGKAFFSNLKKVLRTISIKEKHSHFKDFEKEIQQLTKTNGLKSKAPVDEILYWIGEMKVVNA